MTPDLVQGMLEQERDDLMESAHRLNQSHVIAALAMRQCLLCFRTQLSPSVHISYFLSKTLHA